MFPVGCLIAWKWRNLQVHDEEYIKPMNTDVIIRDFLKDFRKKWCGEELEPPKENIIQIAWQPPPVGWNIMNVDGRISRKATQAVGVS